MSSILQDIRYAVRMLLRFPGFTLLAISTLVLGIGANTAIFSIVNSVLLEPLPYAAPEELVRIYSTSPDFDRGGANPLDALDWRAQNRSFETLSIHHNSEMTVSIGAEPMRAAVTRVTANFFDMLGIRPPLGRTFLLEEETVGNHQVALISHAFWLAYFGGDTDILGRTFQIGETPYEVIGVLPRGFRTPLRGNAGEPAIYRPMALNLEQVGRGGHFMQVIARLRSGVTIEQAQQEMIALTEAIEQRFPDQKTDRRARVVSLTENIVGDYRKSLTVLMIAVGFVLLIACTNVGALFMARAATRQREISVRAAMGATRWQLIRQVFVESLVLSLAGGAIAVLVGAWLASVIATAGSDLVPRIESVGVDGRVLAFTAAAAVCGALLFGLLPAIHLARGRGPAALHDSARGMAGNRDIRRTLRWMIVAEVAFSIILLTSAGLVIRSLWTLSSVEPGFDVERLLFVPVALSGERYAEEAQVVAFWDEIEARLVRHPEIASVSATNILPFSGGHSCDGYEVEGDPEMAGSLRPCAEVRRVTESYFETMGIQLLRGRGFLPSDQPETTHAIVISQSLARRIGGDPIGKRLRAGSMADDQWGEIVGISADIRHFGLAEEPFPELYILNRQQTTWWMTLIVRVRGDQSAAAVPIVRRETRELDPTIPLNKLEPMSALVWRSLGENRLRAILFGGFALIALVLAACGIYGVLSHGVANRTRELGVRMALGADRRTLLGSVLRESLRTTLLGVAIGTLGALAIARLMESLLFGISSVDPMTFILVILLLVVVAMAASWLPARRAMRVDPATALRSE
ncbi:MAG TPA: ABC transporter permease [Thermoanaerobaculia bacterium]|nr:ABC transporter permease [Thermoanaerobaculia bacterium]